MFNVHEMPKCDSAALLFIPRQGMATLQVATPGQNKGDIKAIIGLTDLV